MSDDFPKSLLSDLSRLIKSEIGLYFPEKNWKNLKRGIINAALDLGFEEPKAFARSLLSSSLSKQNFEMLVNHLTIGETFFYRDKKLFRVFKEDVLAEWINKTPKKRVLRIWSAGCCSGEEPYTIAMQIDQMKPSLKEWDIKIFGTDINPEFLEKARQGVYTTWSLRDVPEWIVTKYFTKKSKQHYEISPEIKKMVQFQQVNLINEESPFFINNTKTMDMIFCRNVVMYFSNKNRNQVIGQLTDCLADEGYFVVSPSETAFIKHSVLNMVRRNDVLLYQKGNGLTNKRNEIPVSLPGKRVQTITQERVQEVKFRKRPNTLNKQIKKNRISASETNSNRAKNENIPMQRPLQEAEGLFGNNEYKSCAQLLERFLLSEINSGETSNIRPACMSLLAKSLANTGQLDIAKQWGEKAVSAEKLNPAHYLLLATIYEEKNSLEESVDSLQKAVYLDSKIVLAHFKLGMIAREQGRNEEFKRYMKNMMLYFWL